VRPSLFLITTLTLSFPALSQQSRVRLGAEVFLEKHLTMVEHKRVGIICNHTSRLPGGTHLLDTLLRRGVTVTTLFTGEHGFRGNVPRGEFVADTVDEQTGIPIRSLYGIVKKPTRAMFENVDVILFDMQDVGARYYSYPWTMMRAMEVAAQFDKEFVVLDRPNPINGVEVEGPVLETNLLSSVGPFPVPIRHGLTLGEIARMIVGERWIDSPDTLRLRVVPMEHWTREMWFDDTGLFWIPPSPNMKTLSTAAVYPGTCLFEGTNVSEGRGTFRPFEYIGAPWLDGKKLASRLNELNLPGVRFHGIVFTPRSDSIAAPSPKYKNHLCNGVFIQITNRRTFEPVNTSLHIIALLLTDHGSDFSFDDGLFDKLVGVRGMRETMAKGTPVDSIRASWESEIDRFLKSRAKYLLY
jgi:uncharacterized protein YbbC (DUF1343 family)